MNKYLNKTNFNQIKPYFYFHFLKWFQLKNEKNLD